MSVTRARQLLLLILVIGALARVQAWLWGPPLYPDAYCQYLDPAWFRVSGFGIETWEWRDGIRSWVLPGYHGAWMALLSHLGVRGSVIGDAIQLHYAALSLAMVWAGYRGASSITRQASSAEWGSRLLKNKPSTPLPSDGRRTGLLVALLLATFPQLCRYAGTTLTEVPSMIGLVVGLCITAELVEAKEHASGSKSFLIGMILSFAVCLRIVNAPLALVAPFWLLVCGPRKMVLPMAVGALLPVMLFGVVDKLTWGDYFSSFIAYLKFNVVEGRAADFGSEPPNWYLKKFFVRQPLGTWGLLVLALAGVLVNWPFVVGCLGMLVLISSQPHKEERFMILLWPLLLIAAGITAGEWLEQAAPPRTGARAAARRLRQFAVVLRTVAVLGVSVFLIWEGLGNEEERYREGSSRARFAGQAWLAQRPGATGMLSDWLLYTGGYMWSDHTFPVMKYERSRLANPIFTHVLAPRRSSEARDAKAAGFQKVWAQGDIIVLERLKHP